MNEIIETFKNFLRDPLWQGVGSIATAIVVIFTYLSLRQYKKKEEKIEKREILKIIIQPLRENLGGMIKDIPKGRISNWQWQTIKKHHYYLILRIDKEIVEKIEKFNKDWEKFKNLYYQRLDKLNELFFLEIFSYFRQQGSSKAQRVLQNLSKYPNPQASIRDWFCYWQVGGKGFSTNFFELIFFKTSLQKFIGESKNDPEILNKEISQIRCRIENEEIEKESWDKITNSIEIKLKENKTHTEYFEYSRQIYVETNYLKKTLENFVEKLK